MKQYILIVSLFGVIGLFGQEERPAPSYEQQIQDMQTQMDSLFSAMFEGMDMQNGQFHFYSDTVDMNGMRQFPNELFDMGGDFLFDLRGSLEDMMQQMDSLNFDFPPIPAPNQDEKNNEKAGEIYKI